MKKLIGIFILLTLFGCNSTKETRRAARAEKELKRLTIKYPELAQKEIVKIPYETVIEKEVLDTIVLKADTVFIERENLKVRVITKHDSIYVYAESKERTVKDTASAEIDVIQTNKRIDGTTVARDPPLDLQWWFNRIAGIILVALLLFFFLRRKN